MSKEIAGKWVVPNPQIPRSFGLMNIIFGSILLLTAIGYGAFYIYAPVIQKQFQSPIKQIQEKEKADRAAKIAELKASEADAKTEAEKKTFADERAAIESKVVVDLSAFDDLQNMTAYNEPKLAIYEIFDISTAVVLNVLMIVAGGGLMALKEWARRLAIWVAGLKILRLGPDDRRVHGLDHPDDPRSDREGHGRSGSPDQSVGLGRSSVLDDPGRPLVAHGRRGLHGLRRDRRCRLPGYDVVVFEPSGRPCRVHEKAISTRSRGAVQ